MSLAWKVIEVWKVIEHPSSIVSFETYRPLLDRAWKIVAECACSETLLSDFCQSTSIIASRIPDNEEA